ncbi:MAG: histidine triad nucleotide-binding protein [Myxococcales bacterium]
MSDCLFCRIRDGKIPAKIVYSDDEVLAFDDIDPQAPTHALVIPRRHIATLNDVTEADQSLVGRMYVAAAAIARERGIADSGWRAVMNCNRDANQTVFHIHLHVLGGRRMGWPPG